MSRGKYALDPAIRPMLLDMGLSPGAVLRRAGLRSDLLSGELVWLVEADFFALWQAIEDESDNPNIPLLIEHAFGAGVFAPTIFAAMLSENLNVAAARIATYRRLSSPTRLDVDVQPTRTTITYEHPSAGEPPASLGLTALLFWVELVRKGTRQRIEPVSVTAPEPPADVEAYRAYLGLEVTAAEVRSVTFTAQTASAPFLTANDSLWDAFEPELKRRLGELEDDAQTAEQVRAALLELLPVGRTTVGDVASELAMSARTLHRRLKEDGTTYRQILDSTREGLARHYLKSPNLAAPEIAFLLGYEETSSFYRAFQKWTGETPERVRARLS